MIKVSSPKDLWSGLIYLSIGAAGLWFGASYPMGTAGRMGSGYFPKVLSTALIGFGLVSLLRSAVLTGHPVPTMKLKPLALVLAAGALFALLLERIGFPLSLFLMVMVCAAASDKFEIGLLSIAGVVALIIACTLVFVVGLGIPLPLFGSWLEPFALSLGLMK